MPSDGFEAQGEESKTFEKKINAVICFPFFQIISNTPNVKIHVKSGMTFKIMAN